AEVGTMVLKEVAKEIFLEVLEEIDVARAFGRKVKREGSRLTLTGVESSGAGEPSIDLAAFQQVWVVSFGKAAWPMFYALTELLGEDYRPTRGVVASNTPPERIFDGFMALQAPHPYPDVRSQDAAEKILQLCKDSDEKTLLFFLISGGGSAMVEAPLEKSVTIDDLTELNRVLVRCGASIDEMNAVRKHLSAVKGGRVAEAAAKAAKVTLLLSDVPEGRWATIASGPTLPDPTTVEICYEVAARYHLLSRLPASVRGLVEGKKLKETPKEGAAAFQKSQAHLLLSNQDALKAAEVASVARGFAVELESKPDDWPVAEAADFLLARLEALKKKNEGKPVCLISGGELSSPVTGDGTGGRNLAFVLDCVAKIAGRGVAVLSAGTDGVDGNSPAAGAVADGETVFRARKLGLDPAAFARRSDSYSFFEALGDAVVTGPTGNNLRDVRILLAK
ncbi:MAG: glycerate kinase type-2 family protein, partial [Candidatus Acidiferrales bacterium]